jgi:hypothetical protein
MIDMFAKILYIIMLIDGTYAISKKNEKKALIRAKKDYLIIMKKIKNKSSNSRPKGKTKIGSKNKTIKRSKSKLNKHSKNKTTT